MGCTASVTVMPYSTVVKSTTGLDNHQVGTTVVVKSITELGRHHTMVKSTTGLDNHQVGITVVKITT